SAKHCGTDFDTPYDWEEHTTSVNSKRHKKSAM
uniref:Uncharacterized protein n=1 Tax=Panagrolaimus sp. PS1159 TaxID=55785 RepID=A0AC35GDS9_9BILA